MPNPCEPFAFNQCYGPYLVEIHITLPPGYEDRMVPEGDVLVKRSEVELTLNTAFDKHTARMNVRQQGGESEVQCGTERVYRPDPGDGTVPPIDRWLVEGYLHAEVFPVGYRNRAGELVRMWVETLATIPLPGGAGDITVEVVGLSTGAIPAGAVPVGAVRRERGQPLTHPPAGDHNENGGPDE